MCHKCSRFSNTDYVAYQTLIANPTCKTNYEGSAASMEPTDIQRIYKRSILNILGMVTALLSGLSQRMNHMVLMCQSKNIECVGHVQKRLGTALRKLKTTKSRTPLADEKSIGGRG